MAAVQFDGNDGGPHVSKPVRTERWATQRHGTAGGMKKRVSIMDRLQKRASRLGERKSTAGSFANAAATGADNDEQKGSRTIYFNQSIPQEMRDEEGHLLVSYPRNKIRTAKYTPLSFVPKNLYFQFHNIANIYFLFVLILTVGFTYTLLASRASADVLLFYV